MDKIYSRQEDIVWRNEGSGSSPRVILMVSDMIHQLNEVGSRVWLLADGLKNIDQIAEIIAREYKIKKEEVDSDVKNFVSELAAKDWLINAKN